ncbi:hypothetical protein FJZ19_00610 [Candidatus Pacearchaeota archaeon]|nr:hypothetical protein [Candidatus Pacearchaeota archaeon]
MSILLKILRLRRDLSSIVVIQEESKEGHFEMPRNPDWGGYANCVDPSAEPSEWVPDQPRITEPNSQKREQARQELQKIYDNSKWYQFIRRYCAEKALKKAG